MSLIKSAFDEDFNALGFKNRRKHLRTLTQVKTKNVDIEKDKSRKALMPGKRVSKTGKVYWETRSNRSDSKGKKV